MRRPPLASAGLGGIVMLAALVLAATAAPARAQPILSSGKPLSCPDPSVVDAHSGRFRYYLVCTSDHAADAFPIRGSNDLVHWRSLGYVFPKRSRPSWAVPFPQGRFWAPAIYRIGNRWVVYFAAAYGHGPPIERGERRPDYGEMVIGVATADSITGPWRARLLHFRGEFNDRGGEREDHGGVIDPSVVLDPRSGQRYLFWAEQHSWIWVSRLSADGLELDPAIHQAFWARSGWECATPRKTCVVEGPEEYYTNGRFYLFYSGGSTWTGTYAVGAAVTADPMTSTFQRLGSSPILSSGRRWIGPGGCSAPVTAPNGKTYMLYHAETKPDAEHDSAARFLQLGEVDWDGVGGYYPVINRGIAD